MPSLAASSSRPSRARFPRHSFFLLTALSLGGAAAGAQTPLSHTEDAAPVPAGMLRFKVTAGWTRFDQRFGVDSQLPLGADLSTDALGPRQLPRLAPVEFGLRTLTDDSNVRLTLGRLEVRSDARVVTTPLSLEYGLTRRLSVGVLVPVVQTRRTLQVDVNRDTAKAFRANMGFLLASERGNAATQNEAVARAYQTAANQLATRIASCQQNPADPGCAPINANPAGAAAARARAASYATAVTTLGTTAGTALLAPRAGSALADSIEKRRAELNAALQQYLGPGAEAIGSVFLAGSDFAYFDLQGRNRTPGLLQSTLGGGLDSIRTTDRLGIGDVAVGARFMVFDRFQYDTMPRPRLQTRLAVGGVVRFATSMVDSARNLADIPTGDGAGVEVNGALDLITGRLGGTIAGRYIRSFARTVQAPLRGDPEAPYPFPEFGDRQRRAGDVIGLDVTPRYLMSETYSLNGHYGIERVGAPVWDDPVLPVDDVCLGCASPTGSARTQARTAQRIGLGIRYSTVDAYTRRRAAYPVEVSFTHLETVTGDEGLPRSTRDQIQVRLFYQLFRRQAVRPLR